MADFFPNGFWSTLAMLGMAIFVLFGVDLILFKARIAVRVGSLLNKSFHVDRALLRMLESLKSTSDQEFDIENTLLRGRGRFVAGGVLLAAAFLLFNLLPSIK